MTTFTQKFAFCTPKGTQLKELRLSICIHAHGFSFSLCDSKSTIYQLADYEVVFPERLSELMSLIRKIFSENEIHTFGFSDIKILFSTHKHTWVPQSLFKPENTADYLRFTCCVENTESVNFFHSEDLGVFSIFALNQNLYTAFKIVMPSAQFQSQYPVLVEKTLQLASEKRDTMLLNIRSEELDITVCKGKNFIYSNTFCYNQYSELVYCILNVSKQLALNNENLYCYVGGKAHISLVEGLRDFLPLTSLIPPAKTEEKAKEFDAAILAEYFLIL